MTNFKTTLCSFALCGAFLIGSPQVFAGTFDNFAGSWSGTGRVVLQGGKSEAISCKIQSNVELKGTRAYQKVKCKSPSNKINVRISLSESDKNIVGSWSASGAVAGNVYGRAKGQSLKLQLGGERISAALHLSTTQCRQKMALTGKIGKIRKLIVHLQKSCYVVSRF